MGLIAIIAALLLERALGAVPGWRGPSTRAYVELWRKILPIDSMWRSPAILLLLILPPLILVAWLAQSIEQTLLALVFSGLVLFLCLGPRDLADDLKAWIAARERGDLAGAERLARGLQQGPGRDSADARFDQRSLLGALFIQSHERLFGVLLWFFAFGPAGAVLYRLASRLPHLLHAQGDSPAARTSEILHDLLAWVPARVTALLFGLAGSLDDALSQWRRLYAEPDHGWRNRTWAVLAETASGSLKTEDHGGAPELPATLELAAREVLSLQFRALLILLAFFAFFATGDWFG